MVGGLVGWLVGRERHLVSIYSILFYFIVFIIIIYLIYIYIYI